ncbi:MAG: hypothetical protein KDB14_32995 [Planctomycetales bacterium]|nr:hypothetical protein [Planctomycetales bacterium]
MSRRRHTQSCSAPRLKRRNARQRRLVLEQLESRRPLAIDVALGSDFNVDGIVNEVGGVADSSIGNGTLDGFNSFMTQSAAALLAPVGVSPNGLPDSGFFPANADHPDLQLNYRNADSGSNVLQLFPGEAASVTVSPGYYDTLHLLHFATNGNAPFSVTPVYNDSGQSTPSAFVSPDWFDNVSQAQGPGRHYTLASNLDRYDLLGAVYEDANAFSVFGVAIPLDSQRELIGVDVSGPAGGDAVFNLIGMSLEGFDFGDAITSQTSGPLGARHRIAGPRLGDLVDDEPNASLALRNDGGDNSQGLADEDGVVFSHGGELFANATTMIHVNLQNASPVANFLDAWIDWNGDDEFSAAEQIFQSLDLGTNNGLIPLQITAPIDLTPGYSYARFRVSESGGLGPAGTADTGEVEDYVVGLRQDRLQSLSLTGIDFDVSSEPRPANWANVDGTPANLAANTLMSEDGFLSPFQFSLTTTTPEQLIAFTEERLVPVPESVPQHSPSLQDLGGIISTSDALAGQLSGTWSGLRPGATYDVYAFGIDYVTGSYSITLQGAGSPLTFTQDVSEGWLSINGEQGSSGRTLESYAIPIVADAAGEIHLTSSSTANFNGIAGAAIQQHHYPGPQVLSESVSDQDAVPNSGAFRYEFVVDSGNMASVDVNDFTLFDAGGAPHSPLSVDVVPGPLETHYVVQFGTFPNGDYLLRLHSGDGQIEDLDGADLNGAFDESFLPELPGGDRLVTFTLVSIPWHNLALPPDVNGDSAVTIGDLRILVVFLGTSGALLDPAGPASPGLYVDINDDGAATVTDLRLLLTALTPAASGEGEAQLAPPLEKVLS